MQYRAFGEIIYAVKSFQDGHARHVRRTFNLPRHDQSIDLRLRRDEIANQSHVVDKILSATERDRAAIRFRKILLAFSSVSCVRAMLENDSRARERAREIARKTREDTGKMKTGKKFRSTQKRENQICEWTSG